MKEKIVYAFIFIFLFVLVSAGMIYFNSKYKNIFAFDFSPRVENEQTQNEKLANDSPKTENKEQTSDSLKTVEAKTDLKEETNLSTEKQNLEKTNLNVTQASVKQETSVEMPFHISATEKTKAKKDSIYNEWIKQTVKLYESMDSKKAAKVIVGYSDNIARDILLKMKKKKAAEILAELKPEVVTRIISVN